MPRFMRKVVFALAFVTSAQAATYSPIATRQVWESPPVVSGCGDEVFYGENNDTWESLPDIRIAQMNRDCRKTSGAPMDNSYVLEDCELYSKGVTYYTGIVTCHYTIISTCIAVKCNPPYGGVSTGNLMHLYKRCGSPIVFFGDTEKCSCVNRSTHVLNPPESSNCIWRKDRYFEGDYCPVRGPEVGNPINALKGFKREVVDLGGAALGSWLGYDTRRKVPAEDPLAVYPVPAPASFGALWHSSLHRKLALQTTAAAAVQAGRGGGHWISFVKDGAGRYVPDVNVDDKLVPVGSAWRYSATTGFTQESFNSAGVLQSLNLAKGGNLTFAYSTSVTSTAPLIGLLMKVSDQLGHELQFTYEQPSDIFLPVRIKTMVDTAGTTTQFGYDAAGNLATLTWPDDKVKTFVYERADLPWALTGIVDENDQRFATFGYDSEGRATSTEHAGGVQRYATSWTTPPSWVIQDTYDPVANVVWRDHRWTLPQGTQVTQPNGQVTTLTAGDVANIPRQTTRNQPGGSGCEASSSDTSYDARGNVTSRVDFAGLRSCHAYAADRNFETVRIEGLLETDSCPADFAAYQVPADLPADRPQRKVSTEWHPLWNLEARRAEPKRITTTIYNGEKDPPNTGSTVTCAENDPRLPDNSRIAVVCRRYEQATADASGNLGFTAPATDTRSWSYEYNQYGQVTQESDPRGKLTTYEYWPETVFDGVQSHWHGDLKTVTNALGHKTEYLEYNKRGQPTKIRQPNGSLEQREYHLRGWLTKVTSSLPDGTLPQLTQYDYYATGLLQKATQPDGSWAEYTYDAAHRLTDVADSVGNSVHYVLDNAGNRTAEEFKDPAGVLAKTISRTFDALGRMDSATGLQ